MGCVGATVACVAVDPQEIGRAVREARAGRPQKELADRAGIGQDTWSQVETGKNEPKLSTLDRMAQALGMTLGALLLRAGAIDLADRITLEDMISRDPGLSEDSRDLLRRTYARFVEIDREVVNGERPLHASPDGGGL